MLTWMVAVLCLLHLPLIVNSKPRSKRPPFDVKYDKNNNYLPPKDKINCTGLDWTVWVLGCNHKFTVCHADEAFEFECNDGLYYNMYTRRCSTKDIAGCYLPEIRHRVLENSPVVFNCTGKEDGDYGEPGVLCSQRYFRCINGQTEIQNCKSGHYYESERFFGFPTNGTNHRCLPNEITVLCEEGRQRLREIELKSLTPPASMPEGEMISMWQPDVELAISSPCNCHQILN